METQGNVVITPSVLPEGMSARDYMRICLAMIDSADAVYFLDDYQDSQGARVEWMYCQYIGKGCLYQGVNER